MNEESKFVKSCIEQPELQIVTPTPEKRRDENPMPAELLDVDPDFFLDKQEKKDKERGQSKKPLLN
jgi:hypothetical protein